MYALSLQNLSLRKLVNITTNKLSKVMFADQLMAFGRYGAVLGGFGLWFTHPYGVNFLKDTANELINPTPPAPPVDD